MTDQILGIALNNKKLMKSNIHSIKGDENVISLFISPLALNAASFSLFL